LPHTRWHGTVPDRRTKLLRFIGNARIRFPRYWAAREGLATCVGYPPVEETNVTDMGVESDS
jgi:hypothetical protein